MLLAVIESFVLSFVLLLVCVINIQNGAVGGVHYYALYEMQKMPLPESDGLVDRLM